MSTVESDRELLPREAAEILAGNGAFPGQDVEIRLQGRSLQLRGTVKTFYHKQLAQETLRAFARAQRLQIDNRLDVLEQPSA